jgi:hypothetical protein
MGTTSSVLAGDLLKSMNVVIQELEGG